MEKIEKWLIRSWERIKHKIDYALTGQDPDEVEWDAFLDRMVAVRTGKAPTIEARDEWIPLTKGLPKETGTVLITHLSPFSPSGRDVVSAWFDDDGLFYDSGRGTMMYSDVLAWAYPPKPYMGE